MNIYQIVINSVAASGADIVESGGFINVTESGTTGAPSLSIPKGRIMGAKRVLAGERAQVFTITAPATVSNSVTYTVTVSGKSPVTGILKSFYSTYTTAVSGNTQAGLAASLAAGFVASPDFPFTVAYTPAATSFTITAKSGTPVISVAVSPNVGSNLLTVANTTTALTAVANISAAGVVTVGSGTPFVSAAADLGKMVTINDGSTFYTGIVKTFTSTSEVVSTPNPSAAMTGGNDSLFVIDNTGTTLENVYAYASLPGVTLTSATRYVIYEIDAIAPSYAGNGARPDAIDSKYIIYVNAGVANTWANDGFDATLATKTGFAF
jgi:hypothetical protein